MKYCKHCGSKTNEGKYCPSCGKRLKFDWKSTILSNTEEVLCKLSFGFVMGIIIIAVILRLTYPDFIPSMARIMVMSSYAFFNSTPDFYTMKDLIQAFAEGDYFDKEMDKLDYTNYTNKTHEIIWMLGERCDFEMSDNSGWVQYLVYDRFCIVQETAKILQNGYYIFDYNFDNSTDCKDASISYCYILRTFDIPCFFVKTEGHVLNLVRVSPSTYLLIDVLNSGRPNVVLLGGYIYGKLD